MGLMILLLLVGTIAAVVFAKGPGDGPRGGPFACLLLLLLAVPDASAQCGPNGCRIQAPAREPALTWHHFPEQDRDRLYLFRGLRQVGCWDAEHRYYRDFDEDADSWGDKKDTPPIELPPGWLNRNFGVERDKISPTERITLNGERISKEQAAAYLAGDSRIPDDAHLMRLTVIGPDAARAKVLHDLAFDAGLKALAPRIVVQDYPPDHWAVARAGFFTGGVPTIYLQKPDGKVLHRQDEYTGPADLATAIRKADPKYEPAADPNLLKPDPANPQSWPAWVWLVLAALGLYASQKKEQPK